ncbi:MAG: CDP-diacylglycerol--serine O-phosphatidyltransferase [Desulfobacterales bacterium]|nr:CDP-diacylglycerol--serine O-phosphatidyltransferase [Desulfobacterales bacterium]
MRRPKKLERRNFRKGIYILPNIFTSLNIFCGFYSVISSIDGKYFHAAIAILLAVLFDILDGKIARATNTTSRFGVEYDSLADLISFGLAPGLMMYLWALKPLGKFGWLVAFLFMACGALRLARFNTMVGTISSEYFTGLPIPAGAGMIATAFLFCHRINFEDNISPLLIFIMVFILSILMVSTVKYYSFKNAELFKRMKFEFLVIAILILVSIAAFPQIALFLLCFSYVLSGPIFIGIMKKKSANSPDEPEKNNSASI